MELYPCGWFTPPSDSYLLMKGDDSFVSEAHENKQTDASVIGTTGSSSTHAMSNIPDFDELLYVKGTDVVWQSGFGKVNHTILRSFKQALASKQAVLCNFTGISDNTTNSSRGKCLCILQGLECVKVYAPNGAEFEVALPCKAARLWELPRGILVERALEENDDIAKATAPVHTKPDDAMDTPRRAPSSLNRVGSRDSDVFDPFFGGTTDPGEDPITANGPMLFSLFHPLEELKPVSYTHQLNFKGVDSPDPLDVGTKASRLGRHRADSDLASYPTYMAPSEFMCDPDEVIIMCNSELKIVVTYHKVREAHSIWFMIPSTALEFIPADQRQSDPAAARPFNRPLDGTPRSKSSATSFWDDVGSTRKVRLSRKLSHDLDDASPRPQRLSLGSRGARRPRTSGSHTGASGFERRLFEDDESDPRPVTAASMVDSEDQRFLESDNEEIDDDSDDVIESELFLQCVWTEASGASPNGSREDWGFVAHNQEGTPLICIMFHETNTLKMYLLQRSFSIHSAFVGVDTAYFQPFDSAGSPSTLERQETGVGVPSIPTIKVREYGSLKVRSAQPVAATGSSGVLDIAVLELDGALTLYRGAQRLCSLLLPAHLPPWGGDGGPGMPQEPKRNALSSDRELDPPLQVVSLRDPVSDRVNIVLSDGRMLRVSVPMAVSSPVLDRVLRGVAAAVIPQVYLQLRVDAAIWARRMVSPAGVGDLEHAPLSGPAHDKLRSVGWALVSSGDAQLEGNVDVEWIAFVMLVGTLILVHERELHELDSLPSPPAASSVAGDGAAGVEADPWEQLLQSDYHEAFMGTHGVIGEAVLEDSGRASGKVDKADPAWWQALESDPNDLPPIHTNVTEFVFSLPCIFGAIHLVYEDCRLNQLTWPLLRPLAAVLTGFAKSIQMTDDRGDECAEWYRDHYSRDLGNVRWISFPMVHGSGYEGHVLPTPPDIHGWLLKCIRGSSEPIKPFPFLSSCEFTQQICCFYALLAGGSGNSATRSVASWVCAKSSGPLDPAQSLPEDRHALPLAGDSASPADEFGTFGHWMAIHGFSASTRAERVVLGMVWYEFEPQSLELLPVGLAVPLREALHHCRTHPSSRWPADAFVLVGREDIAALVLAPSPSTEAEEAPTPAADVSKTPLAQGTQSPRHAPPTSSKNRTAVTPIWHRNQEMNSANGIASSLLWDGIHLRDQQKHVNWLKDNPSTDTPLTFAGPHPPVTHAVSPPPRGSAKPEVPVTSHILDSARETGYATSRLSESLMSVADYAKLATSMTAPGNAPAKPVKQLSGVSWDEDAFPLNCPGDLAVTGLVVPQVPGIAPTRNHVKKTGDAAIDASGFQSLLRLSSLRFGSDRRLKEVCRLLRSSTSVRLVVERKPETTDHELVAAQQAQLLRLSNRTMAIPVARGMVTWATSSPLLTEAVQIPSLCLSGRVPPKNAIIKLDLAALPDGSQVPDWPSFHNGAAAGLRLSNVGDPVTPLTRTWIIYNRPPTPNFTHAGFLLSLGLQGQLAALTMADTYDYLAHRHEATTVAVLLGMGAAKRGSMDPTISKMLCLHIPSLLPAAFSDLEVAPTVQTAAIVGVGLLYKGTAHRLMTEFLLAEIGRRPTNDRCTDREGYSLAAGLSLGLVTLGLGARRSGLAGLADLHLEDRLHRYMVGGIDTDAYNAAMANDPTKCSRVREGPYVNINVTSAGATLALGLIFLKSGNESVAARLALPDTHFLLDYVRPDLLMLRVVARSLVLWDSVEPTEEWLLGQLPKVVLSSFAKLRPPQDPTARRKSSLGSRAESADILNRENATHRLNRRAVSAPVPSPDHGATPARDTAMDLDQSDDDSFCPDDIDLDMFTISEPASALEAPGRRSSAFSGRVSSGSGPARSSLGSAGESSARVESATGAPVDEHSVRQAHANIIAGACLSIGLRFVGTALQGARDCLIKYVNHFKRMRSPDVDGLLAAQRPDSSTLEMCLGVAALSLALVMAGTGDLACLKLLRSLRSRLDDQVTYGQHMCLGMAVGLLFLGGGRASISSSNEAIAMLLCSLFPRFPLKTDDNQYHLQALRHLYVLAAENRCVDAYDVTSKAPCYVPLEVTLRENALASNAARAAGRVPAHVRSTRTTLTVVTPGLLPPLSWISAIKVSSPRYWPVEIQLDGSENAAVRHTLFAYRTLCVKRKVGHLSYVEDPRGLSSLLSRPRPKLGRSLYDQSSALASKDEGEDVLALGGDLSEEFLNAFTEDPYVLAFARQFCSNQAVNPTESVPDRLYHPLDIGYGYGRKEAINANRLFNDPTDIHESNAQFAEFCTTTLYHCLTNEKPDILNTMLALYQVVRAVPTTRHSLYMTNILFMREFYDGPLLGALKRKIVQKDGMELEEAEDEDLNEEDTLIPMSFLNSISASVSSFFRKQMEEPLPSDSLIGTYIRNGCSGGSNHLLHSYLAFHDIPPRNVLKRLNLFTKDGQPHLSKVAGSIDLAHSKQVSSRALLVLIQALRD